MQAAQRGRERAADMIVLDEATSIPTAANARAFHVSEKKPLVSPARCGTTILTSGNTVSRTRM